jgi:5'-nucleotidase
MGTSLKGWILALVAIGVTAVVACGGDDSGSGGTPQGDAGPIDGSSSGNPEGGGDSSTGPSTFHVVLLHTNDLHGHLMGHEPELDYTPLTTGDDTTLGGFARIAAKVSSERAAAATAGKTLVLADAGDYSMGTAFSSFIGVSDAPELFEMVSMGYDAMTFGNHEFDFTSLGLAGTFQKSIQRGKLPPVVATNMIVPDGIPFKQLINSGLVPTKKVVSYASGLRIGFVGIMGKGAASVAPLAAPVTFTPPVDGSGVVAPAIQQAVDSLRNDDKVDLVIALSHSGTDDKGQGEDNVLAAKSKGIDIIVSGHTHVELSAPVSVPNAGGGTTYIVQTGAYGLKLGKMDFTYKRGTPGVTMDAYALGPIDDTIAGDSAVQTRVDGYIADIDKIFTAVGAPFRYKSPIGATGFDLLNTPFQETALGDLVTDAYLAAANAAGTPTAMAVEASGNIRAPLKQGKTHALAFADVFNVEPLGIGPDQKPGYPLVAIYLTAKDIVSGLSLSAAAADPASSALGIRDNDYFLQISGASYKYDLKAGASPLQHVTQVKIGATTVFDPAAGVAPPDDVTCYRVVATYYLASLLGLLESATGGALKATPKQPDCATPYTGATLPGAIIPGAAGEIKQWQALAGYIAAQPAVGGVPTIAALYAAPQGRIVPAP